MSAPFSLLLLGAGKMGGAMLDGWLASGIQGSAITIIDPDVSGPAVDEWRARGVRLNPSLDAAPDVVIVAVKPQLLDTAAAGIRDLVGPESLIVSIAAGKRISNLSACFPAAQAFIRAMPNTPASVGRGITGVFASRSVSVDQRDTAENLLRAIGTVLWVESEDMIDAVTAVSGSGPAYVFYLTECLARAGIEAGLPQETAQKLARATVEGAGELMFREPAIEPSELRVNVTSLGGTTAAALHVLMSDDGMAPLMIKAVAAAKHRASELAG